MEVNFINQYSLNSNRLKTNSYDRHQTANTRALFAKNTVKQLSYPITFGAKTIMPEGILKIRALTELQDLPCIYCGSKMISKNTFDLIQWPTEPQVNSILVFLTNLEKIKSKLSPEEKEITKRLSEAFSQNPNGSLIQLLKKSNYKQSDKLDKIIYKRLTPKDYTKNMLKIIRKYSDRLRPVAKEVLRNIDSYHTENPESTLVETMIALRPTHLKKLNKKQMEIFDKVEILADALPAEKKEKILKEINGARNAIIDDNSEDPFKRKKILVSVYNTLEDIKTNPLAVEIIKEMQEIPHSSNSVDAFIVKYSGKIQISCQDENTKCLEQGLSAAEKKIYEKIGDLYKEQFPDLSVQEIMELTYEQHLEKMTQFQENAVRQININTNKMSENLESIMNSITNSIREKVVQPNVDYIEIKKELVEELKKFKPLLDEASFLSLLKAANEMPDSTNDINAFIMKYKDGFSKDAKNPSKYELDKLNSLKERIIFDKVKVYFSKSPKTYVSNVIAKLKASINIPEPTLQKKINSSEKSIQKALQAKQLMVLDSMDITIRKITTKMENLIFKITKPFENENEKMQKMLVEKFKRQNLPLSEQIIQLIIGTPLSQIPTSKDNVSAFIVKYANKLTKNKDPQYIQRSDREIAQSLLRSSVTSVEHLASKRSWTFYMDEANNIRNLAFAHADCNGTKRDETLAIHLKNNTKILSNPQKYIDFIIEQINSRKLKSFDSYPALLKKTLFEESNGLINLDISALKTPTTKELVMA